MNNHQFNKLSRELRQKIVNHQIATKHPKYLEDFMEYFQAYPTDEPVKIVCLDCGAWLE